MPAYSFDNPPSRDSSPGAVKQFWSEFADYATPAQKADFAARGISAPEIAKPQHTMVSEYSGQSYRQFAAAEAARIRGPLELFIDYWKADTSTVLARARREQIVVEYAKSRAKGNDGGGRVDAHIMQVARKELHDTTGTGAMKWTNLSAELKSRMEREGAAL